MHTAVTAHDGCPMQINSNVQKGKQALKAEVKTRTM
jgi:hypothetical protein